MSWSAVDFQRLKSFDPNLSEQLRKYLNQNESRLDDKMLHVLLPAPGEISHPWLPAHDQLLTFEMVIDYLSHRVRLMEDHAAPIPHLESFHDAVRVINEDLWEYLEILEESATELFDQVNRTGLEYLSKDFLNEVTELKDILQQHLTRLQTFLPKLEDLLHTFKQLCKAQKSEGFFSRFWRFFEPPILDPKLLKNTNKTLEYLSKHFDHFRIRFYAFDDINQKVAQSGEKFKSFVAFKNLENVNQTRIYQMYRLLKFWEFDRKQEYIKEKDLAGAMHRIIYKDRAYPLLKCYLMNIQEMLLETSRVMKTDRFEQLRQSVMEGIQSFKQEAHTLRNLAAMYRQFLLKTDPNPYVSSRWGFVEWVVGPEPRRAKELMKIVFDAQKLEDAFSKIENYLNHPEKHVLDIGNVYAEMNGLLHEMSQPLMSRTLMQSRSERLVNLLDSCQELCTSREDVVEMIGEVLTKALRLDWKYQVLPEIPLFEEIYRVHIGILEAFEDRTHQNRLQKIKHIIQQVLQWVKSGGTYKHVDDIEYDINDMRELAQDFLASVQRFTQASHASFSQAAEQYTILSRNLLEYRYLFDRFFHQLRLLGSEGEFIRVQFLFLDQYFESIETKLHNWKSNLTEDLPQN